MPDFRSLRPTIMKTALACGSVVVPVRGAVALQAVTVVGLRGVTPADIGLIAAPVRQYWPGIGARLGGRGLLDVGFRNLGVLGVAHQAKIRARFATRARGPAMTRTP